MKERYYHGGAPGLKPGDRIEPKATGLWPLPCVHATSNLHDAFVYAALENLPGGDVYEVVLEEPIEEAAGRPVGSVLAPAALVIRVERREVLLGEAAAAVGAAALGMFDEL